MAASVLTGKDIARMAVAIEERGVAFYTRAAENFREQRISQTFIKLAEEEKEHAQIFRRLFAGEKEEDNVFDPAVAKYIKSILESTVFPAKEPGENMLAGITTAQQALAVGIQAEKDAILFYQELYQNVTSEEARNTLSKLLEEEKMHLIDLRSYLEEL
ncbi:MAG: ferritin-like domain-containing protein [Bacillota bacterium]